MENNYDEKIELLSDLLSKRIEIISMRLEVLEKAMQVSDKLITELLSIQRDLLEVARCVMNENKPYHKLIKEEITQKIPENDNKN
jgi:hypothetical protein